MQTLRLGTSDVVVSDVCLGTMTYGNQTDASDAHHQMDRAVEAGVTFLDTAEMYPVNPVRSETIGRSEEIIGDWLAGRGDRSAVQIATKISGPSDRVRREGYSGAILRRVLDESLARLKTDYIDLYQLHWPVRGSYAFRQNWDYNPSHQDKTRTLDHMADVLDAMDEAVKAGKVRAFGLSNESAWGTLRWIDQAERTKGPRVVAIQNEYSMLNRLYDTDLAEVAVNEGVTLLAYSPLAAGLLTGKYRNGAEPQGSRAAVDRATGGAADLGGRRTVRAEQAVAAYQKLANELRVDPIHMAIAWTRQRPFPVIPIIGATNVTQLVHLLSGLDLRLNEQQLGRIEKLHREHPMPF
ncbi:aldo/keto reductase [Paracoccus sulfuroxidans]|uniref:Aryl-alcohol dehydrogenase-like predicted oxidoreductase n=1 Tax=Paracoccus sulfuroxidans TaxID=384678 RepID=A0A562NNQ2_9RHOB|nr:aldo/keto reductase [Paracoccus sulfuroxidans]TWI33376.1 aryl-alcohol dehydrogenase-like predicted oxidoreductase [Paracoccus sulfuroxidans]